MTIEIEDLETGIRKIKMSGKSATQSFSLEFLPSIADAIDQALRDVSVKAIILTG